MGGFSGVLKPAADVIGKQVEKIGVKELPNWWTSFQGFLEKSETGKVLRGVLEKYEVNVKQAAQDLVRGGMNPEDAQFQARDRMQRIYFGHGKENLARAVNIARQEKGGVYAQTMADNLSVYLREGTPKINTPKTSWRLKAGVQHTSPYTPVKEIEQNIRHAMSYSFTSRIAIPHLSQGLNSVLLNGVAATTKAVKDVATNYDAAKEWALTSGALFDEILYNFRELSHGQPTILTKLFHQPGFKAVRNMQLIVSALAGKYSAEGEFRNLLRNPNDNGARVQLKVLGLNPDELLRNGLTEGDKLLAGYRSAAETMFIRSELQTPPRWDATPLSRALFMYKHYTFNEGRFIKDMIKKSAKQGPMDLMKTMAVLGIAFPIVGEFVKNVELMVTGTDPTGERAKEDRLIHSGDDFVDEYVDGLAYSAGLGMFYTMMRAANRNALSSYIQGPIIGFLGELGQDIYQIGTKGNFVPAGRTVLRRIPVVGSGISNTVLPIRPKKHSKDEE